MGNITYCIIDVTDPHEEFECEGEVIKIFFGTSPIFNFRKSRDLIKRNTNIENKLRNDTQKFFNIFHLAAHAEYYEERKNELDYSCIYGKFGKEIFRPDSLVRARLQADVFLSTCCETFNDHFLEVIQVYGGIRNFIAPKGSPLIGDTIVFSLMFYNDLISEIDESHKKVKDDAIIESFKIANKAYKAYKGEGRFLLYNHSKNRMYE